MEVTVHRYSGKDVLPYLADAARLRISVFREYPYLYDGSVDYEQEYLRTYAESERAVMVLALAGDQVVGVSTGLPMIDADEAFRKPFIAQGFHPEEWFYFGESLLDPAYRGHGVGHRFFDEREAHALEFGFLNTTFCSVIRPEDHPLKPVDYRSHDVFWTKRGFSKQESLICELEWKQIDTQDDESSNKLVFWTKSF